jgi:6-phosphofructokinase 2
LKSKYLEIIGSLSEDLHVNFYQLFTDFAKKSDSKVIVDASEEALKKISESVVYQIKTNKGELGKLIGVEKLKMEEVKEAARQILSN